MFLNVCLRNTDIINYSTNLGKASTATRALTDPNQSHSWPDPIKTNRITGCSPQLSHIWIWVNFLGNRQYCYFYANKQTRGVWDLNFLGMKGSMRMF